MKKLTQNEKIGLGVYIGWAFIHFILLFVGFSGNSLTRRITAKLFWPFYSEDDIPFGYSSRAGISGTYDFTEFLVYAGTPIIIYIIYKLVSQPDKK